MGANIPANASCSGSRRFRVGPRIEVRLEGDAAAPTRMFVRTIGDTVMYTRADTAALIPAQPSAAAESGRREHKGATAELRKLRAKIERRVGRLEDVHLKRYENYPKLLAAFERERRIAKLLRPAEGVRGALRLIS